MNGSTIRTNYCRVAGFAFLAMLCVERSGLVQADMATSYDGQLTLNNSPSTAPASGMISQNGRQLQDSRRRRGGCVAR